MTPKNRQTNSIDIVAIEVEHQDGILSKDLNEIAMLAAFGDYPLIEPINNLKSELSGKPAYLVRVDDVQMALSFDEMDRFIRHDLRKKEVEKILDKYGSFHAVSGSFYTDGKSWQPMGIAKETKDRIAFEKKKAEVLKLAKSVRKKLKETSAKTVNKNQKI
jgi:hypothetical protein